MSEMAGMGGFEPDLIARLTLALRAAASGERGDVGEHALPVLTREFCDAAHRLRVPPERALAVFKDALGSLPSGGDSRVLATRESLIQRFIREYYGERRTAPAVPQITPPEGLSTRPYVAIVEDDPEFRMFFSRLLEPVARVRTFPDARQALGAFYGERPDIVVLDSHLPDYSGPTLLSALRADERLARVPAVVVTGDDRHEEEERMMREGFAAYFRKPLDEPQRFVERIVALAAPRRTTPPA